MRVPELHGACQQAACEQCFPDAAACPLLQPLFGYAMPVYRYGSLASLIRDTCDR